MSSSGACGYFLCDLCWASWEWALIAVFCVVACYLRTKYNWKWYRIFKPIPIGLILSFLILAFTGLGVDDPEDFHDPTFFLLCWNGLLFGFALIFLCFFLSFLSFLFFLFFSFFSFLFFLSFHPPFFLFLPSPQTNNQSNRRRPPHTSNTFQSRNRNFWSRAYLLSSSLRPLPLHPPNLAHCLLLCSRCGICCVYVACRPWLSHRNGHKSEIGVDNNCFSLRSDPCHDSDVCCKCEHVGLGGSTDLHRDWAWGNVVLFVRHSSCCFCVGENWRNFHASLSASSLFVLSLTSASGSWGCLFLFFWFLGG